MNAIWGLFAAILLFGTDLCHSRDDGYTDFSPMEVDDIVARHNYHRANTKPPASNMLELKWDANLATMSQKFVDRCYVGHGGTSGSDNLTPYSWVGQNFASGAESLGYNDGVVVTDMWHSEEKDFFYGSNWCSTVCGHYTQVVWAATETVGCGRKMCGTDMWGNEEYFVICNYGPGGNWQGKKPFESGAACSKCPDTAPKCSSDGLCNAAGASGGGGVGGGGDGGIDGSGGGGGGGGSDQKCQDDNDSCPEWAERGECEINMEWMLENCKKSCKQCGLEDDSSSFSEWASRAECEDSCKLICKQY